MADRVVNKYTITQAHTMSTETCGAASDFNKNQLLLE